MLEPYLQHPNVKKTEPYTTSDTNCSTVCNQLFRPLAHVPAVIVTKMREMFFIRPRQSQLEVVDGNSKPYRSMSEIPTPPCSALRREKPKHVLMEDNGPPYAARLIRAHPQVYNIQTLS